ncbi:GAF domain-containing protein [Streptomyces griseofuscus]|uniref:GAF domain-containing protein n=1 Tax=Streptomyces griseofuscus TaxID=146922 RepID=UPI0037005813
MTPEELGARVRQLARGQCRLRRLLDAVVAISADMEPRAVLEHIVAAAADLVGARYGALDGLGPEGDFVDLVTVGVDEERMLAAEGLPQGHGLLIRLTTDRKPLRVDDIRAVPRSVGFPPCHPRMTTLLGVPLTVRGTVYGNVYLADKTDGTRFTDDDEAILTALASAASVSIEKARLHQGPQTGGDALAVAHAARPEPAQVRAALRAGLRTPPPGRGLVRCRTPAGRRHLRRDRRCHPARPERAGPPGAVRHPVVRSCGSGGLVRTSGPVTGP